MSTLQDRPFKKLMLMGNTGASKSTMLTSTMNSIFNGKENKTDNFQKRDKHCRNQSTGQGKQDLVHEGLFSDPSDWQKMADVQQSGDKTSCDMMELNTQHHNIVTPTTTEENSDINQHTFRLMIKHPDKKAKIPPQKMSTEQPVRENLGSWLGEGQVMADRPRLEECQTSREADCARMKPANSSPALDLLDLFVDALDEEFSSFLNQNSVDIKLMIPPQKMSTRKPVRKKLAEWLGEGQVLLDPIILMAALLDLILTAVVDSSLVVMTGREDEYWKRKTFQGISLQRKVEGLTIESFPTGVLLSDQQEYPKMKIILTSTVLDLIITVMVVSSLVVMTRSEDEYKMRKMFECKETLKVRQLLNQEK